MTYRQEDYFISQHLFFKNKESRLGGAGDRRGSHKPLADPNVRTS
jgi:hypothetical protein